MMPIEIHTGGVRVIAAVIRKNSRFLICQRPNHKRHGGLWEFPGGKFQDRETAFEAAARELAEEIHLEVLDVGDLLFRANDPGSPFLIDFFDVEIQGTPQAIEHREIRWCCAEELMALPLAPTDARFVKDFLWKD